MALFVILAILAYLADDRHQAFRWATIIWLFVLVGGLAASAAGIGIISILPAEALETGEFEPDFIDPAMAAKMALLLLGVLGAALASLVGFSRRFRVWLAQYLPFDPDSFVYMIALVTILALILIPPGTLLVTGVPPSSRRSSSGS